MMTRGCAALLTGCTVLSGAAYAGSLGPGDYADGLALLSDFQQSYGQVVGSTVNVGPEGFDAASLTAWGLYWNYDNLEESPPSSDDFTLRFHEVTSGDPEEAFDSEFSLGSGTRTDTGEILNGSIDLKIYRYDFDLSGLGISLPEGDWLISLINDVGSLAQAQSGGYWHWANGGGDAGETFFRRENAADFPAITTNGFQDTIDWTQMQTTDERAYSLVPVPTPTAALAGCVLLGGVAARRNRRAAAS